MLLVCISLSFTHTLRADNIYKRCQNLIQPIRKAHYLYFGLDFPYWYSVAQAEQESLCRQTISRDGIGSYGFAQITWKYWKKKLKKAGIDNIHFTDDQAKAQAYINHYEFKKTYCKKLFEMYQRYNGGSWVTKELKKSKICKWVEGLRHCKRGMVCVYYKHGKCIKKKSACKINYNYSLEIYKKSKKYKSGKDGKLFKFW